jgi:hypothetical protein
MILRTLFLTIKENTVIINSVIIKGRKEKIEKKYGREKIQS